MLEAARRFARWVLLVHVLALLVVVGILIGASRHIYRSAREQAEKQAIGRQELLAGQTARGIESFYNAILDDLRLLSRTEDTEQAATRPAFDLPAPRVAPNLWRQMSNRAQVLFITRRNLPMATRVFPPERAASANQIAKSKRDWIASVTEESVSTYQQMPDGPGNLVCVPMGELRFVVVVPIRNVETRFLDELNSQQRMSATLLDETGNVMATSDSRLVGTNLANDLADPKTRNLARQYMEDPSAKTQVFDRPLKLGNVTLSPRMITAEPIEFQHKKWSILIASETAELDAVVSKMFRTTMIWAIVVIVAMTAILLSTAIQLIRGRIRLERVRHELLSRELSQARKIQLAWLPNRALPLSLVDIAAINQPASHISGDFYNWFELADGRTVVVIGDVTGHGMSAAFLMATTQLLVRTTMPRHTDPGQCLEEINRHLCVQAFNGQFVTMLAMVIDMEKSVIDVATAGHFPPLVSENGRYRHLKVDPQLVLGVDEETTYPTQRFTITPSASLLLYTDGVLDAQSVDGRRFGEENLINALDGMSSPGELLERTLLRIAEFKGEAELADDLTLVAIQLRAEKA